MSCDTLQDALVDVARGRDAGAGTIGAVEAHIEHCASCRARFARELSLSEGLRALARANASAGASAGTEATLLAAFPDHVNANREPRSATRDPRPATRDPRPATRDPRPATRDSRTASRDPWLRAAAAITVWAAAGVVWWMTDRSRPEDVRSAPTVATKPEESRPKPSDAGATSPPTIAAAQLRTPTVATAPRHPPARSGRNPAARIIRPDGFVALPSAAGLPAFESGEIVRVEVPVTSLPMYGIDIAPDARGPAVEADFLVGQDGQARAIRLVRSSRL